jgi:hypothetical protein
MKFNKDNYRYIDHTPKGSNTREIIAIASYLGSVVKGYAKCDPRDTFDSATGEMLAALRCNEKVAEKRMSNAIDKVDEAVVNLEKAQAEYIKAMKYLEHARSEYEEAGKMLDDFEKTLN